MGKGIVRIIRKIFTLGIIVTIILLTLNYVYLNGYFINTLEVEKFSAIPKGIQVANTGNSHSEKGINYDDYKQYICFNFALSGQPLIYDYLLLNNYSDFIEEGAVIFIEVSYFSLYYTITDDDASMLSRYYYILDSNNMINYSLKDDLLYHYFPILAIHPDQITKITKNIFDYYYKRFTEALEEESLFNEEEVGTSTNLVAQMKESGEKRFNHHYRHYQMNHGLMNEAEVEALENIMKLCEKNKWRPILVTAPCTAQYTDYYPEELVQDVTVYLYNLAQRYGVAYLDYSKDEIFREDLSLFSDSDHLNAYGASIYTEKLMEWCKKEGYLQ